VPARISGQYVAHCSEPLRPGCWTLAVRGVLAHELHVLKRTVTRGSEPESSFHACDVHVLAVAGVLNNEPHPMPKLTPSAFFKPSQALPQGTSMACPHVAGTVALIISQAKAVGRTLTLAQILAALQDTAQPLSCPVVEPYVPYVRPPAHAGPGCAGVRVAVMINVRALWGRHIMAGHPAGQTDPSATSPTPISTAVTDASVSRVLSTLPPAQLDQ
jgi:hypothetical protein